MTICKLAVLKELDKDVQSVFIAVKMQVQYLMLVFLKLFVKNFVCIFIKNYQQFFP